MNIEQARDQFTTSNKFLRQQRKEFINRHRVALMQERSNIFLDSIAREMHANGLYADPRCPMIKDTRFHIFRTIWRIETEIWGKQTTGRWHDWISKNSINWSFQFTKQIRQIA